MSGNPFRLQEEVNGEFKVEKIFTTIRGFDKNNLKWNEHEYEEYLSLNEIFEQIVRDLPNDDIPLVRIEYETGLWGVIFEVGNYPEIKNKWIVHGITKGYA